MEDDDKTPEVVPGEAEWDAYMTEAQTALNKANPPMSDEEWEAGMKLLAEGERQGMEEEAKAQAIIDSLGITWPADK